MTKVVEFPLRSGPISVIPARAVDDRSLDNGAFRLLATLGSYADRDGWCWPSATTLAKRLGVTRRRIQQQLRKLEEGGYIESVRRYGDGGAETSAKRRIIYEADEAVRDVEGGEAGLRTGTKRGFIGGTKPSMSKGTKRGFAQNTPLNHPIEHTAETAGQSAPADRSRHDDQGEEEFENFWRLYPSRGGHSNPKRPAKAKFVAALKRGVPAEAITRGAENYRVHIEAEGSDPKFVAQALTWLTQARWEQYQQRPERTGRGSPGMC